MSRMMRQHRQAAQKRKAYGTQDFQNDREPNVEQPNTDDVRVAAKKHAGAYKGHFVSLVQTPKNTLELIPNHTAIAEFISDNADHLGDDILAILDPTGEKLSNNVSRHNVWGDKQILRELLDDSLSNGWHWLNPEDIGALTDAPVLEAPDGSVYWHERYQIESAADELLQGNTVRLDGAPENKALPSAPPALPPIDPKAASRKRKKKADVDAAPIEPIPSPSPAPSASGNPYSEWKSENLIETIESLTDSDTFAQDKPEQKAVEQMAEVLSARPVEPEPAAEQAKKSALKMARIWLRKSAATGITSFPPSDENTGKVLEGDHSLPEGREFQEDNTGVTHPHTDTPQKFASIHDPAENAETSSVLEGDKSIPEGKDEEEDNTGVTHPPTELPKAAAAAITLDKALRLIETITEELQGIYLDAKAITTVNETRPVRDAVESIFHSVKALGNAQKVLAKQKKQDEEEAAAAEANAAKAKKSSSLLANLKLASVEVVKTN